MRTSGVVVPAARRVHRGAPAVVAGLVVLCAAALLDARVAAAPRSHVQAPAARPPAAHVAAAADRKSLFLPWIDKSPIVLDGPSRGIAKSGDFVYLGDGGTVAVVDVSVPERPFVSQRLGPLTPGCAVRNLAADGEHVYAVCMEEAARWDLPGLRSTVAVIAAASALRPAQLQGQVAIPQMAFGLAARAGIVYVAALSMQEPYPNGVTAGLLVVDARRPQEPAAVRFQDTGVLTQDMLIVDALLYGTGPMWADGGSGGPPELIPVTVFDVSVSESPRDVARLTVNDASLWPWWAAMGSIDHFLLVGGVDWNLHVLDLTVPEEPEWHEHIDLWEWGAVLGVAGLGEHIVVVTHPFETNLLVLAPPASAARPDAPVAAEVVGSIALPGDAAYDFMADLLVTDGRYAFVAGGDYAALYVADVGNPAVPRVVGMVKR